MKYGVETVSPAMVVRKLMDDGGFKATIVQTPIENNVFAVIDAPNINDSVIGNFKLFSIKIKTKDYHTGYRMLKEVEAYLHPIRNITIDGAGSFSSFFAESEPRLGGIFVDLNHKYIIMYQDYKTYNSKPRL
jgi:hypothetical protein